MRIAHQKVTVRGVVFSKPAGFLYFAISLFFIYKSMMLLPIWLTVKDGATQAEQDYDKKVAMAKMRSEDLQDQQTELGKERYQKDFFNKLDEGENLIVLYQDKKEQTETLLEEPRKMFWWQEVKQSFDVWWKNLELKEK
jgi:hypothetical protein